MRWKVDLIGIEWDDGKGEYDVSDLPDEVLALVAADTKEDAILFALQDVGQTFGSLIAGTEEIKVQLIK